MYIYEQPQWPNFEWENEALMPLLGSVRNLQGRIVGKMEALGFNLMEKANLENMILDVIKSNEIEGEDLEERQVRSSMAKRLGIHQAGIQVEPSIRVNQFVNMVMDVVKNAHEKLTKERLYAWHEMLFPEGDPTRNYIRVGQWRQDLKGRMEVVSSRFSSTEVHFTAPHARYVDFEMNAFLEWVNAEQPIDPVLKAAITHLWFLTIHPFEDGNGRIGRALLDMMLVRADGIEQRFYSMSYQIKEIRKGYYGILEETQKGKLNITYWLQWFLTCLQDAILAAEKVMHKVIEKHKFWLDHAQVVMNERQNKLINKLLDGFEGKLTSVKWGKIAKCSADTALRDIQDLIAKGVLIKEEAGGRSTSYALVENGQQVKPLSAPVQSS